MKRLIFLLYLLTHTSITLAQSEQTNLNGWSVYSKDPSFKLEKLKQKGVVDRSRLMDQRKNQPEVLYSYDVCEFHLKKIVQINHKLEIEQTQQLCYRSLNIKESVFLAIYRTKYNEHKLIEFRKKMNDLFAKKK